MAPHPALLNAIYAVACCFSPPSASESPNVAAYERIFLNRAQRHLDDALAHVDRLLDFLQATTLLAQYNLMKGNIAKGCYLANCRLYILSCYLLPHPLIDALLSCSQFCCWVRNAQDYPLSIVRLL